jgi:hypothetical protein
MIIVAVSSGFGKFDGLLDFLSVTPFSDIEGDFNGNGVLDAADIDQLSAESRVTTSDPLYDLNADSLVNDLDRQFWIHNLKQTYFGDADLNGTFDSTDLVQVLAFCEYEDEVELNSTWLTGDWDGDGEFTSGDLVVALADGGMKPARRLSPSRVVLCWRWPPPLQLLAIDVPKLVGNETRRKSTDSGTLGPAEIGRAERSAKD